jgi:plastocyanin domain-containing protein
MGAVEWIVAALGLAVTAVVWWLIVSGRLLGARGRNGAQELRVRVNGGYVPDRIVVRAGAPVRLIFRREETAACSEAVVFPDFGTSVMLPAHRDVAVELPASDPGEHEFTCRMGVLHGRLVVVGDGAPSRETEAR